MRLPLLSLLLFSLPLAALASPAPEPKGGKGGKGSSSKKPKGGGGSEYTSILAGSSALTGASSCPERGGDGAPERCAAGCCRGGGWRCGGRGGRGGRGVVSGENDCWLERDRSSSV